ncbi:NIPSNAP family protein [Blastococcus sp. URHD0036]|uniref:NIPSNAP family protein n=1 Tax=Blastococcus sp. URHD0036 TaxID=1380356 RepID=UPI00068F0B9B|nr:NIPSNAP family protein [Blastococcus sp. URHD0036]
MTTVQLRRYRLEPGRMADFLAWFPTVLPVREQFGFRVVFAYADSALDTFTWAVAHDGDEAAFTAAVAAYDASPEKAAAFETFPRVVTEQVNGFVDDVLAR